MQSDGFVDPANTSSADAICVGIAIKGGVATQRADIVVHGPIVCVTGATPGSIIFASDTAGEPSESAGTKNGLVGWAESTTVVFVSPQVNETTI
ncbi:MAG: hypothetical protein DRQ45_01870 [Gammaproteobacteria bacterium]|nr:MAG: hypothetical protein DRQ45_01870 [Gammaproteobacteria bacterium]